VKNVYRLAMLIVKAALITTPLIVPMSGLGQTPAAPNTRGQDGATRAKRIAEQFEAEARVLTIFDRRGRVLTTVGERGIYNRPAFSPDGKRLAVAKFDLETNTQDIWVLDVARGNTTRITSSPPRESTGTPVWSPDGSQLAYGALRGGYYGLYRKASNGQGTEELLYKHPGAGMTLIDWSMDGRFLTFFTSDLSESILYALPAGGVGERKPIEALRSELPLRGPTLSPDSRFLSYGSSESGGNTQLYVRPFDPSGNTLSASAAGPWRVSDQVVSPGYWKRDGKEMYYSASDRGIMAVEVTAGRTLAFKESKLLFRLSEAIPIGGGLFNISRDGQRVVITVPHAPVLQQITVLDRQGKVVSKVGELGRYQNPALSPDGTKVAVVRADPWTNIADIWVFDIVTGKGKPITNDTPPQFNPIWSPDGSQVAYVSTRRSLSSIYRKAADGTGNEEQLFQYNMPGAGLVLTDWSADGKFLTCYPSSGNDGDGDIIVVVPIRGDHKAVEREGIEWLREEYAAAQGRLSNDSRFMAHLSTEADGDTFEVHVRPFDASKPEAGAGKESVQVSRGGALGMISWRQDGKELYYLNSDWEVIAVNVTTTPTFRTEKSQILFKLPGRLPLVGNPQQWKNVSSDGQRFVFTINMPVTLSAR
jgi:Tol biopolymer transport system component